MGKKGQKAGPREGSSSLKVPAWRRRAGNGLGQTLPQACLFPQGGSSRGSFPKGSVEASRGSEGTPQSKGLPLQCLVSAGLSGEYGPAVELSQRADRDHTSGKTHQARRSREPPSPQSTSAHGPGAGTCSTCPSEPSAGIRLGAG